MASEKALSDEILRDAQAKAAQTRERAASETKRVLGEAAKEAAAAAEKLLGVARRRADRMAGSILAAVDLEARRELLSAREAELDALFQAARQRLADGSGADYPAVVAGLAAQAIAAMAADGVVVELAERDRSMATEAWLADVRRRVGREVAITLAAEPAPIGAGVIVRSADGRLLYDNSFDARLRRLRPELRRDLAVKAFGNTGGTQAPPAQNASTGT